MLKEQGSLTEKLVRVTLVLLGQVRFGKKNGYRPLDYVRTRTFV